MLIDWFTVGAQTVNFLILVWLMKRFLYKPILDAIDKRETLIANELADADTKKREAMQERDDFAKKNEEFDKQKNDLLKKATDDVSAQRQKMLDVVRSDADALRTQRQESLEREFTSLQAEITQRIQTEVFAIARHALSDLAGAELEGQMCDVFLTHLRELDDDAKHRLLESKVSDSEPAKVRSAMELSSQQHDAIRQTLNEVFSTEMPVRFEIDADIASGIELTMGGQRIAWSIGDYLVSLQKSISVLLDDDAVHTTDAELSATQ